MRKEPERASPEFRSVSRKNKLLEQHYYKRGEGADGQYKPKWGFVQTKVSQMLTINSPRKVFGRARLDNLPQCATEDR